MSWSPYRLELAVECWSFHATDDPGLGTSPEGPMAYRSLFYRQARPTIGRLHRRLRRGRRYHHEAGQGRVRRSSDTESVGMGPYVRDESEVVD